MIFREASVAIFGNIALFPRSTQHRTFLPEQYFTCRQAHPDASPVEFYAFVRAFVCQLLGAHLPLASPAHIHAFVCELTAANITADLLVTEPFATSPQPAILDHTASIDGFFIALGHHPFSNDDSEPESD
jgi:hypothetical protein